MDQKYTKAIKIKLILYIVTGLLHLPTIVYSASITHDGIVAVIGNSLITHQELQKTIARHKKESGKQLANLSEKQVSHMALEDLINKQLILNVALQNDTKISDQEINQAIQKIIKDRKVKDIDALKLLVKAEGLSWEQYQNDVKNSLMIHQVRSNALPLFINTSKEHVEEIIRNIQQNKIPPHQQKDLLENILLEEAENRWLKTLRDSTHIDIRLPE
jgi:parvulin-like peptidyl-prolyl isomerase